MKKTVLRSISLFLLLGSATFFSCNPPEEEYQIPEYDEPDSKYEELDI